MRVFLFMASVLVLPVSVLGKPALVQHCFHTTHLSFLQPYQFWDCSYHELPVHGDADQSYCLLFLRCFVYIPVVDLLQSFFIKSTPHHTRPRTLLSVLGSVIFFFCTWCFPRLSTAPRHSVSPASLCILPASNWLCDCICDRLRTLQTPRVPWMSWSASSIELMRLIFPTQILLLRLSVEDPPQTSRDQFGSIPLVTRSSPSNHSLSLRLSSLSRIPTGPDLPCNHPLSHEVIEV